MIEAVHIPPSNSSLLAGLTEEERAVVESLLDAYKVSRDDVLFEEGEAGEELYLLSEGTVRIELQRAGRAIRLSTISPGVIFGEMALLDNKPRSARAVVDSAGIIHALSRANIAILQDKHPQIAARLMHNIAREIAQRLRMTNAIVLSSADN
jgi:CRP-like cAMP-binding protein